MAHCFLAIKRGQWSNKGTFLDSTLTWSVSDAVPRRLGESCLSLCYFWVAMQENTLCHKKQAKAQPYISAFTDAIYIPHGQKKIVHYTMRPCPDFLEA